LANNSPVQIIPTGASGLAEIAKVHKWPIELIVGIGMTLDIGGLPSRERV
jgi:hypothetical protein